MQQVWAWASTKLEGVFLPDACCCSPGKGPELGGKYGDLVVFSDWDTAERAPTEDCPGFTDAPRLVDDSQWRLHPSLQAQDIEDPLAAREVVQLREQMKNFVQEMVVGRDVCILLEDNQKETGWLKLTPNLMALRLEVAGTSHEMLLRNIRDVQAGQLGDGPVQLDELCSTLMLKGGQCLSFRFASLSERNYFTKCVKVLALALEQ
eukprot:Skav203738  [mRNA]  locus=scaffold68:301037:313185:+ [translate_table: standard]